MSDIRTVGLVTADPELTGLVLGSLPVNVDLHTHGAWNPGIEAFTCDLTLIGADLAPSCPWVAFADTVHLVARAHPLSADVMTAAIDLRCKTVLVLSEDNARRELWRLAAADCSGYVVEDDTVWWRNGPGQPRPVLAADDLPGTTSPHAVDREVAADLWRRIEAAVCDRSGIVALPLARGES